MFTLKHNQYGFYIHGLSPNGRSDVNMLEMYEMLEKEESDLCSKRGLLSNTEQQTFEMFLPLAVVQHWKELRKKLDAQCRASLLFGTQLVAVNKELLVQTYWSINNFLCNFLEHSFSKADYIVKDKSGMESLLNFEMPVVYEKAYFYNGE